MGIRSPAPAQLLFFASSLLLANQPSTAQQRTPQPATQDPVFRSRVDVVLVPTLVLDQKGQAVANLSKEDFQLFDNGKPQPLSGFAIKTRTAAPSGAGARPASVLYSGLTDAPQQNVSRRFIVLLVDDIHLPAAELLQSKTAAEEVIDQSLESSDTLAVISTSARTNTGFTTDRAKLTAAVRALQVAPEYYRAKQSCPAIDHYLAYLIYDFHDPAALEVVSDEAKRCFSPTNPSYADQAIAEQMAKSAAASEIISGEARTHTTLDIAQQIIRQMQKLPGLHTLVLISPGFIALSAKARSAQSELIDSAARANVTVNVLDTRGLYDNMLDSHQRTESLLEEQTRSSSSRMFGRVLDDLAASTGGQYIHDDNDLAGGLNRLVQTPETLYLLEFKSQDGRPDGSLHKIKLKVEGKGLRVHARSAYWSEPSIR